MLMIACLVLKNNKRTTCNWKWIALMLKADTNGILWCFTDISKSRGEAPVQPQLNFPKTLQEDWNRSFKGEWYAVHPWLEYSISEDSTSNKQKWQLCKMIYMDLPTLTDSLTHSHPLTDSLIHWLINPLTHSPSHSPTHPLTHSLSHPLTHSLTDSPTHSHTHSLAHSLTHSFTD